MPSDEWVLPGDRSFVVERDGLRADVPRGWDARIGRQFESDASRAFPVLHAATIPLAGQRADYGGGVVEHLGPNDVFVSLIEFGPEEADTALFQPVDAIPHLEPSMFKTNQLQRRLRGQAGVQHFFTLGGRPFCLYVVLGSVANTARGSELANEMVENLEIEVS